MKTALTLLFVLGFALLGAANLISETFDSALPAGWTESGGAVSHWEFSNTNNAGGSAGELIFNWSPEETGTIRYISPAFNTLMAHDMTLSFKYGINHFQAPYTVSVQISTNLTDWTTVWSMSPTASLTTQEASATISYSNGMSQTTYLAFVFTGYTYNINYWYVDDVLLTYANTLGSGTWDADTYNPIGNVIIPHGHTLTLQAGTTVYMGNNSIMDVDGRLLANGTEESVIFIGCLPMVVWKGIELISVNAANDSTIIKYTNISNSIESGIYIYSTHKVRISNCSFMNNSVSSNNLGGGLFCYVSNIIVENSSFQNNTANLRGAAADFVSCSPIFRNNTVTNNTVSGYGILSFLTCNLNGVKYNQISNNYFNSTATVALYLGNSFGNLERNVINNNDSYGVYFYSGTTSNLSITNCDIMYNNPVGIYVSAFNNNLQIENSIIWGNTDYQIYGQYNPTNVPVRFCCVQNGTNGNYYIPPSYVTDCIAVDPMIVNPPTGAGSAYYSSMLDFRLQDLSPCIDAGSYFYPMDEDFSNSDIGTFTRRLKPAIYRAADVTPDQGHQIDLRWYGNDKDYTWDPSAWYHVFRWVDDTRNIPAQALVVNDPRQITPALAAQNRDICWRDNTRILYFLGQVKAMNRPSYGLTVPTLQDSSSTGTHDEVFVVTYFDNVYFWDSTGLSGYSVDNIPPLAPARPVISRLGAGTYSLTWDEVTEGGWEGNSYPEVNPITYKIYAGDDCEFIPGPASFLLSTTDPFIVLTGQPEDHRLYKITASDSE